MDTLLWLTMIVVVLITAFMAHDTNSSIKQWVRTLFAVLLVILFFMFSYWAVKLYQYQRLIVMHAIEFDDCSSANYTDKTICTKKLQQTMDIILRK